MCITECYHLIKDKLSNEDKIIFKTYILYIAFIESEGIYDKYTGILTKMGVRESEEISDTLRSTFDMMEAVGVEVIRASITDMLYAII